MPVTHALVAVDHDDDVACLKTVADRWCHGEDSHLIVVGVTPALSSAMTNPKVVSLAKDAEGMMLNDLRDRVEHLSADADAQVDLHMLSGRAADEIIKAAILHKADFVMKSADRAVGEKAPMFGAVEKKLIRKCPAPVWIVRTEQNRAPERIAVAVDNTETAANTAEAELLAASLLKQSVDLAGRFDVDVIDVIHAWTPHGIGFLKHPRSGLSDRDIQNYVDEWEGITAKWLNGFVADANDRFAKSGVSFKPKLVMGEAISAIPAAAKDLGADLLVIGSANRSGVPGLFIGNTAEGVIDRLGCSIFVVKPAGFKSVLAPSL